jgi:putative FmdB family regulatory protein
MPNYDFECGNCDALWEQQTTIADRDVPTTEPCPVCEHSGLVVRFLRSAPIFGREKARTPDAFKDILRNMKPKFRGSTINTDGV